MIIQNLRLMCVMGAISLILISCVSENDIATIKERSDVGLCSTLGNYNYMGKASNNRKLVKHYEAEVKERGLRCEGRGFGYAFKRSQYLAEQERSRNQSQRIGAALQGIGQAIGNSSTSTSTISSPNSGVRLLRRRIQTPSIGATDQNLVVYCEYSNGRVVPYYNNVQVQCPAVP